MRGSTFASGSPGCDSLSFSSCPPLRLRRHLWPRANSRKKEKEASHALHAFLRADGRQVAASCGGRPHRQSAHRCFVIFPVASVATADRSGLFAAQIRWYRCRCLREGGSKAASRSRTSKRLDSMTPRPPGRADLPRCGEAVSFKPARPGCLCARRETAAGAERQA